MLTMRFSDWLSKVEEKIKIKLDMEELDEAIQCYGDGWTVDDFATDVMETRASNVMMPQDWVYELARWR